MPKRSSLDLNAMWPYQASVMKAFDKTSRATVAIPLNICRTGLKPRKSINFFRMICTSCKKMPSATFFIGWLIGYRVYGAFGYGLRQVASVCLAIGDAADSPAARSLPGWGGAEPVDDDCGRRGGGAAEIADGLSGLCARVISAMRQGR